MVKKMMLSLLAAGSLSVTALEGFGQNRQDLIHRSSKSAPPVLTPEMKRIQKMLVNAGLEKNPLAKEYKGKIDTNDVIDWGDVSDTTTQNIYLSEILDEASEKNKTHFGFTMKGKTYLIPVENLQQLDKSHTASYAANDTAGKMIDIELIAVDDFFLRHALSGKQSITKIAAENLAFTSLEDLKTLMGHEVTHDHSKPDSFTNDTVTIANISIENEQLADDHMYFLNGKTATLSALVSLAGYTNYRANTETDPVKKREWQERQRDNFSFGPPKLSPESHLTLSNRVLHIYELSEPGKKQNPVFQFKN